MVVMIKIGGQDVSGCFVAQTQNPLRLRKFKQGREGGCLRTDHMSISAVGVSLHRKTDEPNCWVTLRVRPGPPKETNQPAAHVRGKKM